ncbi:microcystin degradation protein MlrC [Paracoccus suum]|uniref:Microcystinase C n=1 Tax=Paracoccus suum TaxID=2259340 RepID=A0A344PPC7_9RHOB|nr:M81 family metallopeptidase [Paracoccus suum]AXC51232.1 microcystin degradation protein MlrC [Paracoccus suum]
MRFVIARLNHETNTFSPLPTPLEAFSPHFGEEARAAAEGSITSMGAFLDFARARGAEVATPVYAHANPSGPVSDEAFETMAAAIVDAVALGCDAILLDLHGAMVTESLHDGEGELLERVRAAAPGIPIGVALDLHGNITGRMLDNADLLVGFKTYPHVDMVETGQHVARLIGRMLDEGIAPARALSHPPLLAQTLQMNTGVPGAMQDAIAAARAAERQPGVLAVSVFGGFSIADLAEAGVSVVVIAETGEVASDVAKRLGTDIWADREGLVYVEEPLSQSVAAAAAAADAAAGQDGPVLMLDHGDNCMSGGTCDRMDVLAEALRQGLRGIIAGPICDAEAVARMTEAGVGSTVTLGLGNTWHLPKIGVDKPPLELTGTVRALGEGAYVISGPTYTGMRCSMGRAAVLETPQALILVSEEPHEPWDLGVFTSMRIDPLKARFLILKSRMYCRPVFEPLSKALVECASLGVTSSDFGLFSFEHLARPIYPLDPDTEWIAEARLS